MCYIATINLDIYANSDAEGVNPEDLTNEFRHQELPSYYLDPEVTSLLSSVIQKTFEKLPGRTLSGQIVADVNIEREDGLKRYSFTNISDISIYYKPSPYDSFGKSEMCVVEESTGVGDWLELILTPELSWVDISVTFSFKNTPTTLSREDAAVICRLHRRGRITACAEAFNSMYVYYVESDDTARIGHNRAEIVRLLTECARSCRAADGNEQLIFNEYVDKLLKKLI